MNRITVLSSVFLTNLMATFAAEVAIDPAKLVKQSDTVIDAIIAVQDAVEAAQANDANAKVTVAPLPGTDARSAAFNREMPWLARGNVKWAGPARTGGDNEDGSHLFRTEKRADKKDHFWWYERMKEKRDAIRAGGGSFDIVMMGDSITHWWDRDQGKAVMADLRKTYSILNLGYGGDKADTLLWRVRNGELDGYTAKLFTIMVGTNNQTEGRDTPERTAATIGEIVKTVRAKQPQAKILLMAVFPRSSPEQGRFRARSLAVSRLIEKYADGKTVLWRDYRPLFLKEDGSGRYNLLADGTHPSPTGVRVWRDAMLPDFEKYTGKRHVPADNLREPCPRRWISIAADAADADSCTAFNNLAVRAQYAGYTGVCADLFGAVPSWDAAAKKRVIAAAETCRDAGLDFIPVLRQQDEAAFAATLKALKADFNPSAVFIVTNGAANASREALRPIVAHEIELVGKELPKAEIVFMATPFVGYASGIPATTTAVTGNDYKYFRDRKWPVMMVVDAESKEIVVYKWNMHRAVEQFMDRYQSQGPREGILYWTATGDYRMMLDTVRLAMRQE